MALFDNLKKKSILKTAIKQTSKARANEGVKAEQLFNSAYEGFAEVVKGDLLLGEALYNWGFSLLHQAKSTDEETAVSIYLDAISKFSFCLLVQPNHLGAAIDGGVAYMDLARIMEAEPEDELYDLAQEFFENAARIQRGSAAYNLACIHSLRKQQDACEEALALSLECGSLPSIEDIINDDDLINIRDQQWFVEFLEKVIAGPETEDKDQAQYDEEGNIIKEKTKDERKHPVQEINGVTYDVEGNVISRNDQPESVKTTAVNKTGTESSKRETVPTPQNKAAATVDKTISADSVNKTEQTTIEKTSA